MSTGNLPVDQLNSSAPAAPAEWCNARLRAMRICFCAFVLMLAIYQLSENTTDPDLWGHIVYGQEMLHSRSIPKADIYSYTALGKPWVNHEVVAEIILGGVHALLGGSGVLLLKVAVGLLAFGLSLRLGMSGLSRSDRFVAWAMGALAVVEISYGFAARPQIFTALFLVVELALLLRIHAGAHLWALGMPVLFGVWINTHGGALAGFGLLGLSAGSTTCQFLARKIRPGIADALVPPVSLKTVVVLWLALFGATAALFCNPWKAELLRWLIGSVLWLRPEITEWNPTPFGWDHAVFFILMALTLFSWIFTRRPRAWWAMAACAAFAFLGWRALRNAPLFSLVALALTTPHLADVLARFSGQLENLRSLLRQPGFQKIATVLLVCATIGIGVGTFTLHKSHPLTMEIPGSQYPNEAVAFMHEHELRGKSLVFFDWGEMVIFHLPECPPSLDGRLDTCYSRAQIAAQWKFYKSEPYDTRVFNPDDADLALLPRNLAGTQALSFRPGWKTVYMDETAVILARNVQNFPRLSELTLPVIGPRSAGQERVAFADHNPRWK
ncbi:hypothetical protein [Pedosphaera parvula]|uniref:Glycosyltransferase RgtA/B/C/D-like domain-containing protein n=1 Tax=Pedosphaera parvula (strain Ellin514) TaxID=320771 RepID=B9XCF0_PEDPL|nr:hypothetical protein [Pedosphaera parvula]EEF62618.1 hypothetical protein Cflav_PD5253 [Pedosphaera parvula Ellin514]